LLKERNLAKAQILLGQPGLSHGEHSPREQPAVGTRTVDRTVGSPNRSFQRSGGEPVALYSAFDRCTTIVVAPIENLRNDPLPQPVG
jgi:hypothetical protein